jgi:hypothetical protein
LVTRHCSLPGESELERSREIDRREQVRDPAARMAILG